MIYVDSSVPLLDPVVRPQRCAPGRGSAIGVYKSACDSSPD